MNGYTAHFSNQLLQKLKFDRKRLQQHKKIRSCGKVKKCTQCIGLPVSGLRMFRQGSSNFAQHN